MASARAGCGAINAGTHSAKTVHKALEDTFIDLLARVAAPARCKLLCRFAKLNAMLLVERIARAQGPCELRENLCQQAIMQVDYRLTPILARSHKLDGGALFVGIGVELRMSAKTPDVGLIREIDRDLSLVGDWMH